MSVAYDCLNSYSSGSKGFRQELFFNKSDLAGWLNSFAKMANTNPTCYITKRHEDGESALDILVVFSDDSCAVIRVTSNIEIVEVADYRPILAEYDEETVETTSFDLSLVARIFAYSSAHSIPKYNNYNTSYYSSVF